ncbi:MAG: ATP-binding cassette domain-containing protein [Aeriscardovia sp.]|nr:ATP-binding cassette domain-containing protein [Aeriscardovia sp.]
MDAPVVLECDDVYKDFKLPTEQATGLKQAFINWTKGIRGYRIQHVLKGVSFQVHQGEFFGIVGRNGGGKSTLLKIISQIYYPNKGSVSAKGKLVPFIELGVGFNPELTGRENVYLNGAMLGFSHAQMDAMYDDIVEFAEIGDFMDQKLKNYSSGMQVRLAFSVAVKAQADILVLDEVLAVGDESFQRKCNNFFTQIKRNPKKTVILVTHDMGAVKRYCTRAMLIKDGKIATIGDKNSVAEEYTLLNLEADRKEAAKHNHETVTDAHYPEGLNSRCPILRTFAISSPVCSSDECFEFGVEYQFDEPGDFYLAISVNDTRRGGITYDTGSKTFRMLKHGHHIVKFSFPVNLFNNGEFTLYTSLRVPSPDDDGFTNMVAVATGGNACSFVVRDDRNADYALLSDRVIEITSESSEDDVETLQWNGWYPGAPQVTAEARRLLAASNDPLDRQRLDLLEKLEKRETTRKAKLNAAKLSKLRVKQAAGSDRIVPVAVGVLQRLQDIDLSNADKVAQVTLDDVHLTDDEMRAVIGADFDQKDILDKAWEKLEEKRQAQREAKEMAEFEARKVAKETANDAKRSSKNESTNSEE